jgi:hypothetical protein
MAKSQSFVAPIDMSERVLADGRVLVPGEHIDLDDEARADDHNARLIEEGQLLEAPSAGEQSPKTKSTQKDNGGEV